jgi:photosystem II stability/assembly factor-like uncharacterized protein
MSVLRRVPTIPCILVLCLAISIFLVDYTSSADGNRNDVSTLPDDGLSWAVGDSGMVLKRCESTSNGGEWEQVTVAGIEQEEWDFHGVFCADLEHVWIVGNKNCAPRMGLGIILKTIDGGKNWYSIFPSPPGGQNSTVNFIDIQFENSYCGWIQTGEEYILTTTDCGYTWVWERKK